MLQSGEEGNLSFWSGPAWGSASSWWLFARLETARKPVREGQGHADIWKDVVHRCLCECFVKSPVASCLLPALPSVRSGSWGKPDRFNVFASSVGATVAIPSVVAAPTAPFDCICPSSIHRLCLYPTRSLREKSLAYPCIRIVWLIQYIQYAHCWGN